MSFTVSENFEGFKNGASQAAMETVNQVAAIWLDVATAQYTSRTGRLTGVYESAIHPRGTSLSGSGGDVSIEFTIADPVATYMEYGTKGHKGTYQYHGHWYRYTKGMAARQPVAKGYAAANAAAPGIADGLFARIAD